MQHACLYELCGVRARLRRADATHAATRPDACGRPPALATEQTNAHLSACGHSTALVVYARVGACGRCSALALVVVLDACGRTSALDASYYLSFKRPSRPEQADIARTGGGHLQYRRTPPLR